MRATSAAAGTLAIVLGSAQETGEHTDWPRWCGKVYQSGYPSFEPGGHTTTPDDNGTTNLYVQFKPRYNIYVDGESTGSFVINAALSPWYGSPWTNSTSDGGSTKPFNRLYFSINLVSDDRPLIENSIEVNTTGFEVNFDLSGFTPSTTPYGVVLYGASEFGDKTYNATSSFLYLPENPSGSVTKIDNLKGSLLFKNVNTDNQFQPLLPYGYYGLYNGSNSSAVSDDFVRNYTNGGQGLNAIIALAGFDDLNPVYDSMDHQSLPFMYDLRGSYENLSIVEQHVNTVKHHTSLFAYWTADEPDGWQKPFDAPAKAQDLIHQLDPYHPVAITLNCQDYYFGPYSLGGDILMEDVYPIGINSTFSKWNTTCNTTLGDCGCDNCQGNVQDVSSRLDDLSMYEFWLGMWPKPKFHNPQVFHGENYWFRDPTPGEARVMNALAFNRGATGIFGWTWPGSWELFDVHSDMSAVVTRSPVRDFLLNGKPKRLFISGEDVLDMAYWSYGNQIMVSVVNAGYVDIGGPLSIPLPEGTTSIESIPFGGLPWKFAGSELSIDTLPAMTVSLLMLSSVSAQ
ncbi:hypothetical protein JX265_011577 [Neoarthrinium moseri]|uniref:Glycoside hydrolase subgroup catalytic core protein n=1 Tax=Neoarthrinium moseri TaxID=1658444 RepID=A0A9Q0AJE9_9PEZI|nr:hypothetical protein JX265_011577 [Neoarthrinium moseri]